MKKDIIIIGGTMQAAVEALTRIAQKAIDEKKKVARESRYRYWIDGIYYVAMSGSRGDAVYRFRGLNIVEIITIYEKGIHPKVLEEIKSIRERISEQA